MISLLKYVYILLNQSKNTTIFLSKPMMYLSGWTLVTL